MIPASSLPGMAGPEFQVCPNSAVNGGHGIHHPDACPDYCPTHKIARDLAFAELEGQRPQQPEADSIPDCDVCHVCGAGPDEECKC